MIFVKCLKCTSTNPTWIVGKLYLGVVMRANRKGRRVIGVYSEEDLNNKSLLDLQTSGTVPYTFYEEDGIASYGSQSEVEFAILD